MTTKTTTKPAAKIKLETVKDGAKVAYTKGVAVFGEAKDWHGLRRFRLRGLEKVNGEALLIAAGLNLKRLLSRRGWGRRPWPSGAPGLVLSSLAGCLLSLIQVLLAALKRRGPRPRHTLTHVRDVAA